MNPQIPFRVLLAFPLFAILMPSFVAGQDAASDMDTDILALLDATKALELGKQMSSALVPQYIQGIKELRPDIPPELLDVVGEEIDALIEEELPKFSSLVVAIYKKHFTHEDIKGLLHFYNTELGRKTIHLMPSILQDSMQAGQVWGQGFAPEIEKRLIERFKSHGYDLSA